MTDYSGKVFGSYKLLRPIGSGGNADVYEARHIWLKNHVAVKVLNIRVNPRDSQAVRKSLREALIANRLRHPHIIPILDCNVQNGIPYIVMPLVRNGALSQVYGREICLPWDTLIDYIRQATEALTALHAQGFIHGDIKPQNLLLQENGNLLLGDFGTVAFIQHTTGHSQEAHNGTIAYMAPERFTNGKQTPASDVYSLGIVTYQWLAGRLPFTGSTPEIMFKHLYAPVPIRPLHALGIDPAIQQVLLKALAKNPRDRYQSAIQFYEALKEAGKMAAQSLRQAQPQGRQSNSAKRLFRWLEMTVILMTSMLVSFLPGIVLYIKGVAPGTGVPISLVCMFLLLSSGSLVRKNWLTLKFTFADFAVALMFGIITQSLTIFYVMLPLLLLISAIFSFWRGYRA